MEYHKWMIALLTLLILISGASLVITVMDMSQEEAKTMSGDDYMRMMSEARRLNGEWDGEMISIGEEGGAINFYYPKGWHVEGEYAFDSMSDEGIEYTILPNIRYTISPDPIVTVSPSGGSPGNDWHIQTFASSEELILNSEKKIIDETITVNGKAARRIVLDFSEQEDGVNFMSEDIYIEGEGQVFVISRNYNNEKNHEMEWEGFIQSITVK